METKTYQTIERANQEFMMDSLAYRVVTARDDSERERYLKIMLSKTSENSRECAQNQIFHYDFRNNCQLQ